LSLISERRVAWVCVRDAFVIGSFEEAPRRIATAFGYDSFFVDTENAFVILVDDEFTTPRHEFRTDSVAYTKSRDLELLLRRNFIGGEIPATSLYPPNDAYWIDCFLPDRERESNDRVFMREHLEAISPMVMRVYHVRPQQDKQLHELRSYIETWHQRACSVDVGGERLEGGPIEFHRVTISATKNAPVKDGYDVVFPYTRGVTWPWVELYVNARRSFPKRRRPSFEFVPTVGWNITAASPFPSGEAASRE